MDSPTTPIWLRAQDGRPGPRPRYTFSEIGEAAIQIADADGLDKLSMRGVATALGTGPASLYRYVTGKTDIEDLMADRIAGEYVFAPITGDVRTDVLMILEQIRAAYRRHPWLADISTPARGPNGVRLLDRMVAALTPLGADAGSSMLGIALLSGWAMNFGSQESADARTDPSVGAAHVAALADPEQHPHLSALLREQSRTGGESMDVEETFRRGVDSLLAGIGSDR
ncbi:TetR/AcrR family transcriptional regulator [Ruania zhangjianzhongii]|uniref:TetR/AcrR family transcriptional regulator n=1 Tax=Ruania zhangjianzhongii TaxID=2603206 RepID=UPI001AEFC28F|nr:TetR/AcrR family transcriptional regulator C-terminal domain-containing protein [Ruania zhangjianzhongii]